MKPITKKIERLAEALQWLGGCGSKCSFLRQERNGHYCSIPTYYTSPQEHATHYDEQELAKVLKRRKCDADTIIKEHQAHKKAHKKAIAARLREREEKKRACYILNSTMQTGRHTDETRIEIGERVKLAVSCYYDKSIYSRSCKYAAAVYYRTATIPKGWRLVKVGGLATCVMSQYVDSHGDKYAGELKASARHKCIRAYWHERTGRGYTDVVTVEGWLYRGYHVCCTSKAEAIRIVTEKRRGAAQDLLAKRKSAENERIKWAKIANVRVRIEDSLEVGNCLPGTMNFVEKYRAAVGYDAEDISIKDLKRYAEQFGVSYYADRIINKVRMGGTS